MNYANFRHGSACEAALPALKRAGIVGRSQGAWFGVDASRQHDLRVQTDGSILVFGGAGSGKSAGIYATNLLTNAVGNSVTFDPRGELSAISVLAATLAGYEMFTFNPTGRCDLPQHGTRPLDHLTVDSPSLIADTQKAAMDICPATAGSAGKPKWWEAEAQDWLTNIILHDAERNGCARLRSVYDLLNSIQGDTDTWRHHLDGMSFSRSLSVRRFSGQIAQLQEDGRDSFTAPLGTLQNAFRFMQDPRIAAALDGDDFSMGDPCDPKRKIRIQIIIPIEYAELWAPGIRLLIGAAIQAKLRNIEAPRVSIFLDECGQLGPFNSVRELYTFGRGANLFGLCAWQEISQLNKAFGVDGANEIVGSAQFRVFKGVRTIESARLVSDMAGTMTLDYDAEIEQSNARRLKERAVHRMLDGGDFLDVMAEIRHQQLAEGYRQKQARRLYTPDEVLNLPPSQMVAFASGLVEGPIRGHWPMYFEQARLAGKYLPNPHFDADRVRLKTRWGSKVARIVRERVPERFAHLPQYESGYWSYIEGYYPK